MLLRLLSLVLIGLAAPSAAMASSPEQSWWWDPKWWHEGQLPVPTNHPVESSWTSYKSGDTDIAAFLVRPRDKRKYPAVLYLHGRRGMDELIQLSVRRLAARGFVVLAPDIYQSHFIEPRPITHDYKLEADANRGLDALLARPDISSRKACIASHTRGGYIALKLAVTFKRQVDAATCTVSWYPHMQDPNAPEPMQVYGYAHEADELRIPTLIFVGENEQFQRKQSIELAVKNMTQLKRPVQLIVYPGVGRGFDFRLPTGRTFADDLATQDSMRRAADFMRQHLQK